jgi:uncharacterized protein YigA (DUF484 family)
MSASSDHLQLHSGKIMPLGGSDHVLSSEQVAQFLRDHPDFFVTHEQLLTTLRLPQADNGTLSLVGRQSELLREKQNTLEQTLHNLHSEAQANEYRALHLHRLAVHLVRAVSPCLMLERLREHLCLNFDLEAALLHLDRSTETAQKIYAQCPELDLQSNIGSALAAAWASLYQIKSAQIPGHNNDLRQILRRNGLPETASTAVIPIEAMSQNEQGDSDRQRIGILLLIKRNPQGFSPDMGRLFLEQISELVSASLVRLNLPGV